MSVPLRSAGDERSGDGRSGDGRSTVPEADGVATGSDFEVTAGCTPEGASPDLTENLIRTERWNSKLPAWSDFYRLSFHRWKLFAARLTDEPQSVIDISFTGFGPSAFCNVCVVLSVAAY